MGWKSDDRVLAGIAHLGILAGWVGLIIALAIYVMHRDRSDFVRRSAQQAVGYQICTLACLGIVSVVFGWNLFLGVFTVKLFSSVLISEVLIKIVLLAAYVIGIWGALHSFQGQPYKYPFIGEFVERI